MRFVRLNKTRITDVVFSLAANNGNGQGSIYRKQGKEIMAFLGDGIGISFFL